MFGMRQLKGLKLSQIIFKYVQTFSLQNLNLKKWSRTKNYNLYLVWLELCPTPRLRVRTRPPRLRPRRGAGRSSADRGRSPLRFCRGLLLCLDCRKCNITFVYNQQELEPEAVTWLKSATQPVCVCVCVCVAQPPGFGNDRLDIGKPKWRRRAGLLSVAVRRTDGIERSALDSELGWAHVCVCACSCPFCCVCVVSMLGFYLSTWLCIVCVDWVCGCERARVCVCVSDCVWLTHNPSAPS